MLSFRRLLTLTATCALPGLLDCAASQPVVPRAVRRAWRAADADMRAANYDPGARAHCVWYFYKDPIWRQLRPAADAPVYLIESQSPESGLLYGVAWSGTDTLTYRGGSGEAVRYGREGDVLMDDALARALVQWRTGPCPTYTYEGPQRLHPDINVLQVYWPDGRYLVCKLSF